MALEIERKFLVVNQDWKDNLTGTRLRQGYLSTDPERTVRVRVAGEHAWLTIKGGTRGITRAEFEYAIPLEDANALLDELCLRALIDKTRYLVTHAGMRWDVDEFHGENAGLVIAEIELSDEQQAFERPGWLGKEVSDDPRYFNSNLARKPYARW